MGLTSSSLQSDKERLRELHAREIARCKASFPYFLFKYVRTQDPHTPLDPVKPFPRKKYLEFLAYDLQYGDDMEYWAKSRQLMVSWILCAFTVWKMQFFAVSHCYFQSKKESDAAEMVYDTVPAKARMSFIMVNLPDWLQVGVVRKADGSEEAVRYSTDNRTFTYGNIILPNGSHCTALAQGAAQIEGKVPAWYVSDEASLQDEWALSQSAVVPCLEGGGRGRVVGTMRMPSDYGTEIATCADVDPDAEMRGVARFKSRGGIPGIRIHYSADPDKDPGTEKGRDWFTSQVAKTPGGYEGPNWQAHMEISPEAITGTRCFDYFPQIEGRVVVDDVPNDIAALWVLGSGADYGTRNPSVLTIFGLDYHGNAYALREISEPGGTVHKREGVTKGGIAGLAQLWKLDPFWHRINGTIQMDSTTEAQNQNTEGGLTSVMQMFANHGVFMQPAKARGDIADDLTINWLHERWAGHEDPDWAPTFFVCRGCTGLINILKKAEYADWSPAAQSVNDLKKKMRPTVGMDSWDALKHWVVSLPQGPTRLRAAPPTGSFAWQMARVKKHMNAGNARS